MESVVVDEKNFPYTTKDPEILGIIKDIFEKEKVPMADRVAKLTGAGAEYNKKVMEVYQKLIDLDKDTKWEQYFKEDNFSGYTMKGEEGCLAIRSVGIIPCTPIEVISFLGLQKYKNEYDEIFIEGKAVEEYATGMKLVVESFRGKMLVSSRDFCFAGQTVYHSDGSIIYPVISVEDPRVPPIKPHVRARPR